MIVKNTTNIHTLYTTKTPHITLLNKTTYIRGAQKQTSNVDLSLDALDRTNIVNSCSY